VEPTQSSLKPKRRSWTIVVTVCILAVLAFHLKSELDRAAHRLGFFPGNHESTLVREVVPDAPAARAGLKTGDRLLAIDGEPLREVGDYERAAAGFHRGIPVRVEVARGDDRLQLVIVPGGSVAWGDFLLSALACLLYLGVGLLASGQRADDLRSTLLAAFCLAVSFEMALPDSLTLSGGAAIATSVAFLLVTGLQFGLDLNLATVLPAPPEWLSRYPWVPRIPYVIGIGFGVSVATLDVLVALGWKSLESADLRAYWVLNTWLLPVWAVALAAIIGKRVFTFPDPRGRQQAGLVLMGVLPWVTVVLHDAIGSLIYPDYEGFSDATWNFALLAYPVAVFVAIYLYRLFDLELVVRKSFLYGGLTTLLVLGFYGLVAGVGGLAARQLGSDSVPLWVLSTAGLTMGLLFYPLRARLQGVIDRRLFPERQALRSRLVALAEELPAQGKLSRMGAHLAEELSRIFAVEPVVVWGVEQPQGHLVQIATTVSGTVDLERTTLISSEDPAIQLVESSGRPTPASVLAQASPTMAQRLHEAEAELVVPLVTNAQLSGLLLLGRKRDEPRFVAEELELLTLVGRLVASVFDNARLFGSATYEGLTGLYRREKILEILDREWGRSQRYDRPLAIAIADLDHFKSINDRHGHLTGDLVLKRVASELQHLIREPDFLGRFGGEEFLMVLPEGTREGARQFAEKVRQRIEALQIQIDRGEPIRVTLSIGVASRDEVQGETRTRSRALIAAADAALYEAKNRGRNRVEAAVAG